MQETQSLGHLAYDAYGEHQAWRNYEGKLMPSWASVRPDIQQAWEKAARAVVKHLSGQDVQETQEREGGGQEQVPG